MNLLSKLGAKKEAELLEPRKIFMTLPSKSQGYGYPRDVQTEVWNKWYKVRNEKNVIIKMNTGSGKTVVGLIILQSCLNEGKGPAVYVVPDKFLVKQVVNEANRLGIRVTENKDDYLYLNKKAILVTTIQRIVNGRSCFGMRSEGRNYQIGSVIVDDVHACIDKINNQYMIKVKQGTEAYNELINLFREYIKDYNPRSYTDIIEMGDCRKVIQIPFWEWKNKKEDTYRLLRKYNDENHKEIYFGLPLIEGCLETCDCVITAKEIEISPKGVDIAKISSFSSAERRVFMSATLADDSVFVSSLGLRKEDMNNIITPKNANDIGDRLILFPKHINSEITEKDIKDEVENIAREYNVVILVPSFTRAKFWDEEEKCTAKKENIDEFISNLNSGEHFGKVVIVNRYDGIDLPGDACRMLVIDGLPPLNSIKDRYIQSISPKNTTLLREQVQRIEQGMGRGVRSNDDECCIVLMGDELSDVLTRNDGLDFFSAATRSQYDLSKQLWDLLVENTQGTPSINQIFELAKYSLEKDPEWVKRCKEKLSNTRYSSTACIDEKVVAMRKAFESSLINEWNEAAKFIKTVKDAEPDYKTKGYLCQILAEYTHELDAAKAQEILLSGKKLNGAILTPIKGIQYTKTFNNAQQAAEIRDFVGKENLNHNQLIIFVDNVLSKLVMGPESDKFESALDTVGKLLGFACSRPDEETGGYGPDNLWAIDIDSYLVIECKTGAKAEEISKDYCNQLSGSINWFYENYSKEIKCFPVIIHPSSIVSKVSSPNKNMVIINASNLSLLRENIRKFFVAISKNNGSEDIEVIKDALKTYKLRGSDIVSNYTTSYSRK